MSKHFKDSKNTLDTRGLSSICEANHHVASNCGKELEELGSVAEKRAKYELGMLVDVVMKLASTLPEGQNYKAYAKFSSLIVEFIMCKQQGKCSYPTVTLKMRRLKKKGRGSFDIRLEANHHICAVKWYVNRAVTLAILCWHRTRAKDSLLEESHQILH